MKFGTNTLFLYFDEEFIVFYDQWKSLIFKEGLKNRLQKLIREDLNKLKNNNNNGF